MAHYQRSQLAWSAYWGSVTNRHSEEYGAALVAMYATNAAIHEAQEALMAAPAGNL
jgi:hypothetical protein